MGWIKVTPETLPPVGEDVLLLLQEVCGKIREVHKVRFNKLDISNRMYPKRPFGLYIEVEDDGKWTFYELPFAGRMMMTHWMPYPEPAED